MGSSVSMGEQGSGRLNEQLREEILDMVSVDQNMRKGDVWDSRVDAEHTTRMKQIVHEYGWPGVSLVGQDGANGAWLLVQHADNDRTFQEHALALIKDAVNNGEAQRRHEAYLDDRVRVATGQPQRFGTQFFVDDEGVLRPRPIEDVEYLDERRKAYGLGPFSEYKKEMQENYGDEDVDV